MVTLFPKPAFGVLYPGKLRVLIPCSFFSTHGGLSTGVFAPAHGRWGLFRLRIRAPRTVLSVSLYRSASDFCWHTIATSRTAKQAGSLDGPGGKGFNRSLYIVSTTSRRSLSDSAGRCAKPEAVENVSQTVHEIVLLKKQAHSPNPP